MAADTAFFQGIIDTPQRLAALQMQFTLSQLITAGVLLALVQCSRRLHQACRDVQVQVILSLLTTAGQLCRS